MRPLITTLVFASSSVAALAQPGGEAPPVVTAPRADFVALDKNKDGYLSRREAAADPEIAKRFAAFDINHDGRLSEDEYVLAKGDIEKRVLRDAVLTAKVKAALLAEKGIPSLSIAVETYEGGVQLSGFVRSPEIVSRAGRVTAGVTGVRTVHNNIAVR